MLKNTLFAGLILVGSQSAMALNLDDVNNAANSANALSNAAQQTTDKAEEVKAGSVTDMAKEVVTEGAKGGVDGALEGAVSGSVVKGGTKGATDGAKSAINKFKF